MSVADGCEAERIRIARREISISSQRQIHVVVKPLGGLRQLQIRASGIKDEKQKNSADFSATRKSKTHAFSL
jgi:hypothetical protein